MPNAELLSSIEASFPERPFPDMTLLQAQLADETLDREIPEEEWIATGRLDAEIGWKSVEPSVLIKCNCALSHLSESGFVYYLPAYMRLALAQMSTVEDPEWDAFGTVVSHLQSDSNYAIGRFKRFSDAQIDVVISFLREVSAHGGFEGEMARGALKQYWETPEARRATVVYVA